MPNGPVKLRHETAERFLKTLGTRQLANSPHYEPFPRKVTGIPLQCKLLY